MNKNEEDKLSNSIIALYKEIKKQGENTGKQLAKMNLALGEMRLSYMKTNEKLDELRTDLNGKIDGLRSDLNGKIDGLRSDFNRYAESNESRVNGHETRIVRLEEKTSGNAYIASEPAVRYTRGERSRTKRKKRK